MSATITPKKRKRKNADKFDNLIGPTDPRIDASARELLISARVSLLFNNPFFGNLATRLRLVNADEWCGTAATDGRTFYYNSRFIKLLKTGEVEFLFGHEVLHVVYDHMGRREDRDPQIWNIANDYVVNADLKKHKVGQFITSVPCLYDVKYEGKISEYVYDDLMKDVQTIDLDSLIDQMIDDHIDQEEEEQDSSGKRPKKMNAEEREQLRQEVKQSMLEAAKAAGAGNVPAGIQRLVDAEENPTMPWRELIQTNLTSAIKSDYSFSRPSRRAWHMDAILPSRMPGEEIDVAVAIDMSGSISKKQAAMFLGEIASMMDMFDGYKLHVFCFDTNAYGAQDFSSDNMDDIHEYEPQGGGGTDFSAIFDHLKSRDVETKRLIVFTDGLPYGTWGDENFCDTTWIIHGYGAKEIIPPFGAYAHFDK
jgi:predicted metal-dependent peptidase